MNAEVKALLSCIALVYRREVLKSDPPLPSKRGGFSDSSQADVTTTSRTGACRGVRVAPSPIRARRADPHAMRSSRRGFAVEIEDHGGSGKRGRGGAHACAFLDVPGFCEAAQAAHDPHAASPTRLVLMAPNKTMASWLSRWAEDEELVRRTITIRRLFDDASIMAVATLASYGYGIDTSLALESIALPCAHGTGTIVRSGVHSRSAIDAALARTAKRSRKKRVP